MEHRHRTVQSQIAHRAHHQPPCSRKTMMYRRSRGTKLRQSPNFRRREIFAMLRRKPHLRRSFLTYGLVHHCGDKGDSSAHGRQPLQTKRCIDELPPLSILDPLHNAHCGGWRIRSHSDHHLDPPYMVAYYGYNFPLSPSKPARGRS